MGNVDKALAGYLVKGFRESGRWFYLVVTYPDATWEDAIWAVTVTEAYNKAILNWEGAKITMKEEESE